MRHPQFDALLRHAAIAALVVLALSSKVQPCRAESAYNVPWIGQLGTASFDEARGVSADGLGNVFVSGYTAGSLPGNTSAGSTDAFVSKYDAAGTLAWTNQLGSTAFDDSWSVSADGVEKKS
jgi:hypothetical protein